MVGISNTSSGNTLEAFIALVENSTASNSPPGIAIGDTLKVKSKSTSTSASGSGAGLYVLHPV
jgi:hypothetical protein